MDEMFEHEWLEDELTEMKRELSFLKNCEFYDDIEDPEWILDFRFEIEM